MSSPLRFVRPTTTHSTVSVSPFAKRGRSSLKPASMKMSRALVDLIQRLTLEHPAALPTTIAYVKHQLERGSRAS